MSESLEAIFRHVIWNFCYLSVLLGLSAYGFLRLCIIYLFLKNRRKVTVPAASLASLPRITVQLPVHNEFRLLHVERGFSRPLDVRSLPADLPWRLFLRRFKVHQLLDPADRHLLGTSIRRMNARLWFLLPVLAVLAGCADDTRHRIIVSTANQKMIVLRDGAKIAEYPVSTSKFGLGDGYGTNATPLGEMKIRRKIGGGAPLGAVFKSRKPTGEIIAINAPGRDPIVTRILWLEGLEAQNRNAYGRFIYIHGTPEEIRIGTPASYGCIRMRSRDVAELYATVGKGARVLVTTAPFLPDVVAQATPNDQ